MYINGQKVKELRESIELSRVNLAEMLNMDLGQLRKYEEDVEDWYEEDSFRLLILGDVLPEVDFLLDIDYLEMLEELAEEYD